MKQPHKVLIRDRNKLFLQKIGISAEIYVSAERQKLSDFAEIVSAEYSAE